MAAANWLTALAIALVLGGLGPALDAPDDIQAARDSAGMLELALLEEVADARAEQAAAAMCHAVAGPGAVHRWTPDGQAVCRAQSQEPILLTTVTP